MKDPQRGKMASIKDLIEGVLKTNGIKRQDPQLQIFDAWNTAAGPMAKRAIPVRFQEGELTVFVESSAHYQELNNFTGASLLRATNRALGKEIIRNVVFKLKR